jgi:hypothetical protein
MTVAGQSVVTDGSTKFKHTKCEDLDSGTTVSVDGVVGANGVVSASQIDKVGGHN